MGNHATREFAANLSSQSTQNSQGNSAAAKVRTLKTSETEPNLFLMPKSQRSLTSKHSHHHSMIGGSVLQNASNQQPLKKAVLANMTSRVLLREQLNSSGLMSSFHSTANLHSHVKVSQQQRGGDYSLNGSRLGGGQQPFRNVSNLQLYSHNHRGSTKCPPQPLSQQQTYLDYSNQIDSSQVQEQYYIDQSNNWQPQASRAHSKSAYSSSQQQYASTQNQSPHPKQQNENIDYFQMQQRLLKKLKNSKKKAPVPSHKQKMQQSRYQNDQNSQLPPMQSNRSPNQDENHNYSSKFLFASSPPNDQEYAAETHHHPSHARPFIVPNAPRSHMKPQRLLRFGGGGDIMPTEIVMALISYDSFLFIKCLMLNPSWHTSVLQAMDEHCNKIENQFVQTYHEHLFFKSSFTSSMPINLCRMSGIRLDRVLECELLNHKTLSNGTSTIKFGYQYKVFGDERPYRAEYKLDVVKEGKGRLTWLHQDKINKETYIQPIQQICIGDSIELAISLVTLQGYVEWIEWEAPFVTETPKLSVTNYNKDWAKKLFGDSSIKIYCDLNRICEIEDAVVEWYEEAYYQRRSDMIDLTFLNELFDVKEVFYAGVDGAICKAIAVCKKAGIIDKAKLGIQVLTKETDDEVVCEAKRLGYLKDREVGLQVRKGDTLIVYISTSSA